MFYDSDTTHIRQSYKCSADSARFGKDCSNMVTVDSTKKTASKNLTGGD